MGEMLKECSTDPGLELVEGERTAFGSWAGTLAALPAWARAWPDWTVLARWPSDSPGPELLPSEGSSRLIWQGAPRLVWIPGAFEAKPGWHADPCCQGGRPTALPIPDQGVPLDLLRRMKTVFDPDGRLDSPPWLGDDHRG